MEDAELTIGQVSIKAGIAASAIRYYERVGVLPKAERVSGQRRYGPDALQRLATIDVAQRAGLSLDEIRELMSHSDSGHASETLQALAREKLPAVEDLIYRAEAMKAWLEVASGCGCGTLDDCDLFTNEAELLKASTSSAGPTLPVVPAPKLS